MERGNDQERVSEGDVPMHIAVQTVRMVDLDNSGIPATSVIFIHGLVAHHNHQVAWLSQPCRSTVQLDFADSAFDCISLETGTGIDVDNRHLLPRQHVDCRHEFGAKRQTAFVIKFGRQLSGST
jgi:hypothetical protein